MATIARDSVILVNEQDVQLGLEQKLIAHQKGLLHRAFSVMLYRYCDGVLQFLLQQRADTKYHCGNLWTNTCCSHPQPNDDLASSAKTRLSEELKDIDLSSIDLQKISHFIYHASFDNGLTEHEYDHVFIAEYDQTPEFFNQDEIKVLQWLDCCTIEQQYADQPQNFTPWFYQVYTICKDYLITNA